jgi:hypothetical protein
MIENFLKIKQNIKHYRFIQIRYIIIIPYYDYYNYSLFKLILILLNSSESLNDLFFRFIKFNTNAIKIDG